MPLLSTRTFSTSWKRGYKAGRLYTRQHPTKPLDAEKYGIGDDYDNGFYAGTNDELDKQKR